MARVRLLAAVMLLLPAGRAYVGPCDCDPARPETMQARECSLCAATDLQPPEPAFFAIRDTNPRKPNRWLALPRFHGKNPQDLAGMTPVERTAYWTFAIQKGREMWADEWGLAINSLERRTQCHMHIHIGKLAGEPEEPFVTVDGPGEIPLPKGNGDGLLVHAAGGKLHVHSGNETPELLLQR